jgi:FMN phosphatase YigB (HAD superfamily)
MLERAAQVSEEIAVRRDTAHIETPWLAPSRLIHDFLGIRFDVPLQDLELGLWKASVCTRPMTGAKEALTQIHEFGIPYAVVSNCSFSEGVIRYELAKYGLTDYLSFIMVSAEYLARIPNRLLFDTAAARLGVESQEIWFVGDRLDTDILGAKRASMTALWFCPETQNDRSNEADMVVSSWDEIVRHIQLAIPD